MDAVAPGGSVLIEIARLPLWYYEVLFRVAAAR
jgi:hypothetical protein